MRTHVAVQTTANVTEVKVVNGQLLLGGNFTLACPLPEQDEHLPRQLEEAIESGGQEIKRCLFQQSLERADAELLLQQRGRDAAGFQLRGTKPYRFKTLFGTVVVDRRRVQRKSDGALVTPSAAVWQTPERLCITPGLRAAACDGMRDLSVRDTAAALDERAGEEGLLCASEVLRIVHDAGRQLQAAQQLRSEAALDAEARDGLLPKEKAKTAELDVEAPWTELEATSEQEPPLLGFPGRDEEPTPGVLERRRAVDEGCVLVQADEVKVHAQPSTGQKEILVYTAVVLLGVTIWHLSAATSSALQVQVAGLLASLGVHRGARRLLLVADGARWIRNWFEGLAVSGKAMILCWFHLHKRCQQLLSMACRGREHREEVEAPVLDHLWHGRVTEAVAVLAARRAEMKNAQALEELIGYLEQRRPYLPDYAARHAAGLWIASNRVEKFNDWGVSERCKHRGMSWAEGVHALAALESARRNGELETWRETQQLPAWEPLDKAA